MNTSGITSRSAYWAEEKAKTGDKLKLLQRGGIKGIRTVRVDRRWAGTTHGSHPESSSLVSKSEFKSQTGIKYEITDHNVTTFDGVFESRLAFVNWIWFSYHLHTMTTFSTLQYDIFISTVDNGARLYMSRTHVLAAMMRHTDRHYSDTVCISADGQTGVMAGWWEDARMRACGLLEFSLRVHTPGYITFHLCPKLFSALL